MFRSFRVCCVLCAFVLPGSVPCFARTNQNTGRGRILVFDGVRTQVVGDRKVWGDQVWYEWQAEFQTKNQLVAFALSWVDMAKNGATPYFVSGGTERADVGSPSGSGIVYRVTKKDTLTTALRPTTGKYIFTLHHVKKNTRVLLAKSKKSTPLPLPRK
ncbi:MAG: hypothetical protein SFU56_20595 [Capsulimonadales bacterium]|nr:hypothetical protein [Capsulimonadales bacterium]